VQFEQQFEQLFAADGNYTLHVFICVFVNWRSYNASNMTTVMRRNGAGSGSSTIPGLLIGHAEFSVSANCSGLPHGLTSILQACFRREESFESL
jgi:hypothetical protein